MLRWSLLTVVVVVLLALCGLVFLADGSWWNLVKNLGYAVAAVALVWGLVLVANHFGITGKGFAFGPWLDHIADTQADASPGPNADRRGMAIVVACFLLGLFFLAGSFVHP